LAKQIYNLEGDDNNRFITKQDLTTTGL